MAGIAQTVLINSEPVVGYRGKLSNSNSILFGQNAGTTLNPGDTGLMSSLNISGLEPLNSDAFTIEYWIKHKNIEFDEGIVHVNGQAILGSANFIGGASIFHTASAINLNNYLISNAVLTVPSQAIPSQTWELNEWYHVAVAKSTSSNVTAWINGYRVPEGEIFSPNTYSLPFTILASWRNNLGAGTTNNLIGSLYNLRIVNSICLYDTTQSTISVPNTKLSLTTNTNILLLAAKTKTFIDSAQNSSLSTRAGTTVENIETPFNDPITKSSTKSSISSPFVSNGSGSYYFNGRINSYGTFPGYSKFNLSTGDFTLECFIYAQSEKNLETGIFWYETSSVTDLGLYFENIGGVVGINIQNSSTTVNVGSIAGNQLYKQWNHLALVRISGQVYCYFNGLILNPGGDTFNYNINSSSGTLYIGKKGSSAVENQCFYGYVTNMRLVKGVGVYTGNFTPPTSNIQRFQFANPYGGSNTAAVRTDQTAFLLAP